MMTAIILKCISLNLLPTHSGELQCCVTIFVFGCQGTPNEEYEASFHLMILILDGLCFTVGSIGNIHQGFILTVSFQKYGIELHTQNSLTCVL